MRKLILILIICLLVGCTKEIETPIETRPIGNNRLKWLLIAQHVKRYFKTDMTVREITKNLEAEESYQKYLDISSDNGEK